MVKKTKTKKAKVKKIANVLQRVVVNVKASPSKPRSKNAKAHVNSGFNQFQSQTRIMNELGSMPTRIKEIIGDRRNETNSLMEEKIKQINIEQKLMNRQILNRVEKQSMTKYLDNIAFGLNVDVKQLKSGAPQDIDTGIPI
jgi:hypothetical protein